MRMWFGYTFGPSFFAGAVSKSHAKIKNLRITAPTPGNMVLLFVGVFVLYRMYENMMLAAVCSIQCYMLFVCV
jgi:hypothetical protein